MRGIKSKTFLAICIVMILTKDVADALSLSLNSTKLTSSGDLNPDPQLMDNGHDKTGETHAGGPKLWSLMPSLFPSWNSARPPSANPPVSYPPPVIFVNLPPSPPVQDVSSSSATSTTTTTTTVNPLAGCGCSASHNGTGQRATCELEIGVVEPTNVPTCNQRLCTIQQVSGTNPYTIQLSSFQCSAVANAGDFCGVRITTPDPNFLGDVRAGTCSGSSSCIVPATTATVGNAVINIGPLTFSPCAQ